MKTKMEKLFARYKTYEGAPGSASQWAAQARSVFAPISDSAFLVLGLQTIPGSLDELKVARRQAMRTAHPDKAGGSEDQAKRVNDAYEKLAMMMPRPSAQPALANGLVKPPRCTDELPADLTDPNFIGELKINGERSMLYFSHDPYGQRTGNTFLSRHVSKVDGRYGDRTDQFPHITGGIYGGLAGTIMDGEIFHTDLETTGSLARSDATTSILKQQEIGRATYYVFDIPFHCGRDLRDLPLAERRKVLAQVLKELNNDCIKAVDFKTTGFAEYFKDVTASGGEGLVVKDLRAGYGKGWSKMKKSSDVSAFVTGFRQEEHSISLAISVYENGAPVEIGFVPGFQDIDQHIGKVMDVIAFELTKNNKLRSPNFNRWRADMNADDCTMFKLKQDMKKIGHVRKSRKK